MDDKRKGKEVWEEEWDERDEFGVPQPSCRICGRSGRSVLLDEMLASSLCALHAARSGSAGRRRSMATAGNCVSSVL